VLAIWAERGIRNHYVIAGDSMLPLIQDGDVALVEHGTGRIDVGSIILFRTGEGMTVHRVLRRAEQRGDVSYRAKGDNAPQIDRVATGDVIGRVVAIERGGNHLLLDTWLWQVLGWLIAITMRAASRILGSHVTTCREGKAVRKPRSASQIGRGLRSLLYRAINVIVIVGGRWHSGPLSEHIERPTGR
jgi:hypothetical protein